MNIYKFSQLLYKCHPYVNLSRIMTELKMPIIDTRSVRGIYKSFEYPISNARLKTIYQEHIKKYMSEK